MTSVIGLPLDRKDGRLKVTGQARYAAEFPLDDLAHAVLVQSTIPAGSIVSFDLNEAKGMPGVLLILTPDNAPRLQPGNENPQLVASPTLQNRDVLYNGQHVAVVVADSPDQALAAAAAVTVNYRTGEALTVMDGALDQAYPPKHFRNGRRPPDSKRGDPDEAFAQAPVQIAATYTTPIEHHNPMEPHATIAQWKGDQLTVWTATQGISGTRATLATLFGLKPENVHVICPYVGGGFGCKGNTWPPATLTAMAARQVRRPVKLAITRAQMFTSNGYRPRTIQKLKLGADRSGKLLAIRHDGISQSCLPPLGEFAEPVGLAAEMLYACPNVAVTHRLVAVNAGLPTYMRAPGEATGVYALESAMDELAVALDMDPIELRLLNYADTDPHESKPFSSKMLRECYRRGAEAFGWSQRSHAPRSMRDGRVLIGWGMATSTYPTNRQKAAARVVLKADGNVVVQSGTQDLGTGTYTVMAQVAASELNVPVHRVRVELGDSAFPPAPVSGGSQTVASVGPAVQAAAATVRARVLALAQARGPMQGSDLQELELQDSHVVTRTTPHRRVPVAELMARQGIDYVDAVAGAELGSEKHAYSMHAFGAQFAEVRVDPDIGEIRVSRFVAAFDSGRILNAKTAHSQLMGGIVYGIGMALLEQTHVDADSGRIVNANIAEYLVPVNADIPSIETILVDNDDRTANPLGAKGIGELPMVGVAAAIANAVYHATGVRVRDLPIRVEDVLV